MQRLRIRFGREAGIKFISHLDLIRLWERAFRRARIPLAHSEGFSPHPKISLAAPLAVGVTSEAELMDVFLTRLVSSHWFTEVVNWQLPVGITVLGVHSVTLTLPSLQSQVRYAEYRVHLEAAGSTASDIAAAIAGLLAAEHFPWHHQRDTGQRNYDLRALVDDLRLVSLLDADATLDMRLRCDSSGSGRPEQVVLALGFSQFPRLIHRTRLILGN